MGNEASKTAEIWGEDVLSLLKGEGLDIGAGADPIVPGVRTFDQAQGDANRIDEYIHQQFDFVFSSHCLEHMLDPWDALARWWKLVKPDGHLIVIVPDEDLYEQGYWPSLFNEDHKHTFTLNERSWSPVSINVRKLIESLPGAEIISIIHQSNGYQQSLYEARPRSRKVAKQRMWLSKKLIGLVRPVSRTLAAQVPYWLGSPIDQTANSALAQIQFIVRKKS
jgi:SAM-dependent methyltransferase